MPTNHETDRPTVPTLVPIRQTQQLEPVPAHDREHVQFSDDTLAQTYKQARAQVVARNGRTNARDARLNGEFRADLSGGPLNWALAYEPFSHGEASSI